MTVTIVPPEQKHIKPHIIKAQLIVIVYSVIFGFVLFSGWFYLFSQSGMALASIGAVLLSFLAWLLGNYIGSSEGGIPTKVAQFILLLIISAAGVFNSLMINLEGRTIFQEAVVSAVDNFTNLKTSAINNVRDDKLAALESVVKIKEQQFINEVKNELNCGFGPEARQRKVELVALIPTLTLPILPNNYVRSTAGCSRAADLFKAAIDQEWATTDEAKRLSNIRTLLGTIVATTDKTLAELEALRRRANDGGPSFLLGAGREQLVDADTTYKGLLASVLSFAQNSTLPRSLNLTTLSRLGEWSQIIAVILARLDQISTYVYLLLSVFMDWMLVHLFLELRTLRVNQPGTISITRDVGPDDFIGGGKKR